MPEYLAPGVYVEETSFRSKAIEGVSTTTTGFVGPTRSGPTSGTPELLTSLADFERYYGGLDDLLFDNMPPQTNWLAHAVRAFFEEGGKRLYVMRVFNYGDQAVGNRHGRTDTGGISPPAPQIGLRARFPGNAGNMRVTLTLRAGTNVFNANPPGGTGPALTRVQDYDVVHVRRGNPTANPVTWTNFGGGDGLYVARWNRPQRRWELRGNGAAVLLSDLAAIAPPDVAQVRLVTATVDVELPDDSPLGFAPPQAQGEFGFDRRSPTGITTIFTRNPATRLQALTIPFALELGDFIPNPDQLGTDAEEDGRALDIARELLGAALNTLPNDQVAGQRAQPADYRAVYALQGGSDGALPLAGAYEGDATGFSDYQNNRLDLPKNGLLAFEALEDISIVAAPGSSALFNNPDNRTRALAIQGMVIAHAERMRYRIAVLDSPPNLLVTEVLDFRNQRESKYAALYYPWVVVADPATGNRLSLPPSGFVAGIYARNDIEHAVFKAPANEPVRLAIDFEQKLNKAQQEALNPNGVNCFRFFDGRGYLLWGARTISTDSEWKYVSLRRYFAYLEHSIDRGTQWAVFENNGPQLWANVRRTIEDFLLNEWKMGGLLGDKPDKAYFVRCDLSTMTQNDLDNGRLVCLIGVAVVRPAEFVIFRIGQWTATSNQ